MFSIVEVVLVAVASCLVACSLQGCGATHTVAAWEQKRSYQAEFRYVPVGQPISAGVLNSCDMLGLPAKEQCSGNGICKDWNTTATLVGSTKFCQCYPGWADPECRTPRKSQTTTFILSLFLGYVGADRFYLGEYYTGFLKLSTAGGLGLWWLYDIVREGTAPVYTGFYRVAADLDHSYFVVSVLLFFGAFGYFVLAYVLRLAEDSKRKKKLMLKAEDEFFKNGSANVAIEAADQVGQPSKSTFGKPVFIGPHNNYGATANAKGTPAKDRPPPATPLTAFGAGTDPEMGCGSSPVDSTLLTPGRQPVDSDIATPAGVAASNQYDDSETGEGASAAITEQQLQEAGIFNEIRKKGHITREEFAQSFAKLK